MRLLLLAIAVGINIISFSQTRSGNINATPLSVSKSSDFEVNGKGDNNEWDKCAWNVITKLDSGGQAYNTKFKMLYSEKGIYVLFKGADDHITTSSTKDFDALFKGDVFEVFFQTDTATSIYLEYEINHLNKELVLLVPNFNGRAFGWQPFAYVNNRKVQKAVSIEGGKAEVNTAITGWAAEVFFPYALFSPLLNVPPKAGTVWRANFYRLDYDSGQMIKWAWSPIEKNFHEYKKFGTIIFK
ncbi:carbohydrate-binding family 9-like protein [Danxiaibacter flavus]|uniref:Carbohydrate-binding family 9-like protein n=1 Tax=Danxiaibacter flavus TaxID=3049108 RepID=A0ABV3Z8W9_9BACT|nr:carbohydrate-binding family 9-like protein [Chitinophagaceae bacterium DXS]